MSQNGFFSDIAQTIEATGGVDSRFADDLSVYKSYPGSVPNSDILDNLHECQGIIHGWGKRNRVTFDESKEEFVVLHRKRGCGNSFRLLGPLIDTQLHMGEAIDKVVAKCRPKMKAILRTTRYYSAHDMIVQFKTHVLPVAESGMAAFYHASSSVLKPLDGILDSFLYHVGLSASNALLSFNLAPLSSRRDIAMIGLIHKCVLGLAHPHLIKLLVRPVTGTRHHSTRWNSTLHNKQIVDVAGTRHSDQAHRSVFGLIKIYNRLPQYVVNCTSISTFQCKLTDIIKEQCLEGNVDWASYFSPRRLTVGSL